MEDNGLFYNDQFGFRPGHSTELASPPNMTSKTLLRHLETTYRYCRQRQVVIKMLTIWK